MCNPYCGMTHQVYVLVRNVLVLNDAGKSVKNSTCLLYIPPGHIRAGSSNRQNFFDFETLHHDFWMKIGTQHLAWLLFMANVKKNSELASLFFFRSWGVILQFLGFFPETLTLTDARKIKASSWVFHIAMINNHAKILFPNSKKPWCKHAFCVNFFFPYDV